MVATTAAVILAGGIGARFGGPGHKLRAQVGGVALIRRAVDAAMSAPFDETVVVQGAVALGDLLPVGVTVLANERWAEGMATSLGVALDHARAAGHGAVVVALGDQPGIEPEAWRRVRDSAAPVAIATYDGHRRHPVRLAAEVWDLLPVRGDLGARELQRERPDLVTEIPCPGRPGDIDTVEDLERWTLAVDPPTERTGWS